MSAPLTYRELLREVKRQGVLLERLTSILHTHVRTDLPPDAALPAMKRLLRAVRRRGRK